MFTIARKLTGDLETNYCHLLEGRLFPLFYRTNFVSTLFKAMAFIKDKNVLLNFQYFTN
jgi:ribosomal protein S4